jgi:HSP20 family molecular chaperone IbpA
VYADKVKAKFKSGVLTITAPKRTEGQRKRKCIEVASG